MKQLSFKPKRMGWIPDAPDHRDLQYSAPLQQLQALPASVDLRPNFPSPCYDQGDVGSCTAQAVAGAVEFARAKAQAQPGFMPSRMFIYYNERRKEGTIPIDSGAQIRTGIKSVAQIGVCKEATWPYDGTPADEDTFLFPPTSKQIVKPSDAAYGEADKYRVLSYARVTRSLAQMKGCLAAGFPFTVGFGVYESLYGSDGKPKKVVPLPDAADSLLGGHAVLAVGYDNTKQQFILRNSWGDLQDNGYFYMPFAYLTDSDLSDDFWTVRLVANPNA